MFNDPSSSMVLQYVLASRMATMGPGPELMKSEAKASNFNLKERADDRIKAHRKEIDKIKSEYRSDLDYLLSKGAALDSQIVEDLGKKRDEDIAAVERDMEPWRDMIAEN